MNILSPASRPSADYHLTQVFSAKAVEKGAVIRRSIVWIDREIGLDRFELEVRRRGHHLLETGGQLIVVCNSVGLRVIC